MLHFLPSASPSLSLTDINEEHDDAADDHEGDTNIDASLGTKASINDCVHDDTKPEERSLYCLEETPGPRESFRPDFLKDEHLE